MSQVLEKHYLGKVCCRCEQNLRYVSNNKCVTCSVSYWKEWSSQEDNQIKRREQRKSAYKRDPSKELDRSRRYREQNCEKERERKRREYQLNREAKIAKAKEWSQKNPEARQANQLNDKRRRRAKKSNCVAISYTSQQLQDRFSIFNNCCAYCFERENLTVDHFIPINSGGADALYNLVPACRSCNSSKGAKDPITWMRGRGISEDRITKLLQLTEDVHGSTL